MEKEIIIGIIGLITGYFLIRFLSRKQKKSIDIYSDILTDEKYKVKGRFEA